MQKNLKLLVALKRAGLTQRALALQTGIHESFISMAIHGKYVFDRSQKALITRVLGKPEVDIFPIETTEPSWCSRMLKRLRH